MRSVSILAFLFFLSCTTGLSPKKNLPFLGQHTYDSTFRDTELFIDTSYFVIPDFNFLNQDSLEVDNQSLRGKIYVADFFFSYCPDICIPMKTQMLRIHEEFRGNEKLRLLSHTLDPEHDSIPFLRSYTDQLGADSKQWYFLHGKETEIYKIAREGYMSYAERDVTAPGGIIHGGHFILVDGDGHIRGVYDGTKEDDVDILMLHLRQLLNEV